MFDVLIIGGGPAGVTAALYTARANFKTAIICKDHGALGKAERVDNFYGQMEISGQALVEIGLEQARKVGAEIISDEALGVYVTESGTAMVSTGKKDGRAESAAFCEAKRVEDTGENSYEAHAVILATGATRATPKIEGLAALEGRGVSYCAVCDGFFHRGKNVAVLGNGAYALHEVEDLLPIVESVTLLTDGEEVLADFPASVIIRTEKVHAVTAKKGMMGDILGGVVLDGGEELSFSGLFVAVGIAGGTELARKMGAMVENDSVMVDQMMRTSVTGLWAAGDCTGGMKQIAKAVYEGAEAGTDVVRYLRERNSL